MTGKAADRLWAKDATLWQGPEGQRQSVGGNLAWLDLPEQIGPYIERFRELMAAPSCEAFQDVVFIAMGDSNLAAQALLAGKTISASFSSGQRGPQRDSSLQATVREKGIELYAEAETRQQISTLNLSQALRTFFEAKEPDGYVATMAFAGDNAATNSALRRLREQLTSRLGIPVLLNLGPRYLRTFEQVYKGGPSTGLFLILTGVPGEDIGIPGAGYTFGQFQLALASGDFESLVLRRMRVVQLHCTQGLERGLSELSELENLVRKF